MPAVVAMGAAIALAVTPLASAASTEETDGTITAGSLGSSGIATGSTSDSLGPFGSLAAPAYGEYVALGDSYAALGDNTRPAGGPAGCARSLANYPHVLAAGPGVGEFTDSTCGGAQVPDILTVTQYEGAPPQISTLTEDTDLVTLSIGGNDVGFGAIVQCIMSGTVGTPVDCKSVMDTQVTAAIDATFGESGAVDDVYEAIADAAPDATVVTTQYMPLVPASDEDGCAITDGIGQDNVEWARAVTGQINDAVAAAAERNGHVAVMPTDDVDRSACAPADQRWTSFLGDPNTAQMHPTALGQEAMAAAIADAI
ncbi:SGNH/GDSL hydrolase family protein [Dietzia sp. NCCP-2495]|uniref:SGNH/GDSL hydrolase family protein n=1 Tax=Dietzia sp. NCCP-2495 TaxID=2934675 RepID=UPI002230F721|nr:SGNH/GDSL hydrolase family protein [Dietzia sp. NCCP-2495]